VWTLLAKDSSENLVMVTEALAIDNVGCLVHVLTQIKNPDGTVALSESMEFAPDIEIQLDEKGLPFLAEIGEDKEDREAENEEEDDDDDDDDDEEDDD